MRVALAQLNPVVGDVAGNVRLILEAIESAHRDQADVLVTGELALLGYPPRDLLFRRGVVEACEDALPSIARAAGSMHVIVGHPRRCAGGTRPFANSASVCHDGRVTASCDKRLLPGYDVFDEDRYFEWGRTPGMLEVHGRRLGLLICEDLWRAGDVPAECHYQGDPVHDLVDAGCDGILSLHASPFFGGKWTRHLQRLTEVATAHRIPIVAVNQVGGNDDLVFDGRSVMVDPEGRVMAMLPGWTPAVVTLDLPGPREPRAEPMSVAELEAAAQPHRECVSALVLGVRDYVRKTGHDAVLVGLSGGVDSALVAAISVAALGSDAVRGVMLPSRYSSEGSITDALALARNLGMAEPRSLSIETAHRALHETLHPALGEVTGVTDENLQARLRGVVLMAMANDRGALLLATGNKSELAVGYATLYGDMSGAVAVLGDVLKTHVYDLASWINGHPGELGLPGPPIPGSSITKPPSAELRPDQVDQDTLPPYPDLDRVIEGCVEQEQSVEQIVEQTGLDRDTVTSIVEAIDRSQYKREQAALILKVTPRAFGRGRPMPIVMKGTGSTLPAATQSHPQFRERA